MLRLRPAWLGFFFTAQLAQASTIGIIDSGTDTGHADLISKIWTNPQESIEDGKDNDNNGFTDDIHGWNFFQNNNQLIDMKYTFLYSDDIERFFAIQDKYLSGTATEEEIAWVKGKVAEQQFVKDLTKYGTFVHGTHVAGIAARNNPAAQILTVRLVPVENPLLNLEKDIIRAREEGQSPGKIAKGIIKAGLFVLATAQGKAFGTVGTYLNSDKADVANASLGTGKIQARMIVTPLMKLAMGGKEPSATAVDELATYFLETAVKAQRKIANNAPDTLFVFASGNDANDNDVIPTAPANANLSNTMSVGASIEHAAIAPFSNFGKTTVDVLAPGVAIVSSVPGGRHMALSGTSQASPFVAGVAAHMKDINPALRPTDLKAILIGTVDIKPELKDKVRSSGIVNEARALHAAELSLQMSVEAAIAEARPAIADVSSETQINPALVEPFRFVEPLLVKVDPAH